MTYFCIFGRTPELSLAELLAVLPHYSTSFSITASGPAGCIFVSDGSIHLPGLMRRLGGTIKLGEVLTETPLLPTSQHIEEFLTTDSAGWLPLTGRVTLGVSSYSLTHSPQKKQRITGELTRLFLTLKKSLRTSDRSVRIVMPGANETALSAVTVEKNHLLDEAGTEYVILSIDTTNIHIGRTLAVQPFEAYAARDFERPSRTMTTGLLPPKLAQIMINLGGVFPNDETVLWDPFCGFGTILQEALLLDFSHVIGSDIDPERISDTVANLAWLRENNSVDITKTQTLVHDATSTPTFLNNQKVNLIVTEGFLGPIISHRATSKDIDRAASEVTALLKKSLPQLAAHLSAKTRIIISLPVWLTAQPHRFIALEDILSKNLVVEPLLKNPPQWAHLTSRSTVVYHRPDQQVGREIVVLTSTKN